MPASRRRGLEFALQALFAASTLAACDQSSIADVKPPPGALSLEQIYDSPPGKLSDSVLPETAERFASNVQVLDATERFAMLNTLTDEVSDKQYGFVSGPEVLDPTEGAKLLGLARIKYICRGPEGDDVIDEKSFGVLTAVAKASERGLFPIVWGDFKQCVDHQGDIPYTIDGSYYMLVRQAQGGGFDRLVAFKGTIDTEFGRYEGALDWRRFADGRLEIRVPGEGGDVVVGVKDALNQLARDRDGEWDCQLQRLQCQNEDTGAMLSTTEGNAP